MEKGSLELLAASSSVSFAAHGVLRKVLRDPLLYSEDVVEGKFMEGMRLRVDAPELSASQGDEEATKEENMEYYS
jgi:hypothetical protein